MIYRDFERVTWYHSNRNHAAILHARSNTMAATQRERVPSLRGYRDSLSAENQQMYDDKLKFTVGIDPYAVSDNFYSQSMDEWPEIEFPDIVNYLQMHKWPHC